MKRLSAAVLCMVMLLSAVPASASANGRIGLDAVAAIGSTEYSTFEEAVTACGTDDIIVLLDNVEYTMCSGDCFKVNKNGFTLTVNPSSAEVADGEYHDLVHHEAKSPTCTETGWAEYGTCSVCGCTTYTEIPALNHDLTHHNAKSPTPYENGNIEYWECSRCKKLFGDETCTVELTAEDVVIPKISCGDVNMDGRVNILDVNLLRRAVAGLVELTDDQKAVSDIYTDGKYNSLDVNLLRRYVAGLVRHIPVGKKLY